MTKPRGFADGSRGLQVINCLLPIACGCVLADYGQQLRFGCACPLRSGLRYRVFQNTLSLVYLRFTVKCYKSPSLPSYAMNGKPMSLVMPHDLPP